MCVCVPIHCRFSKYSDTLYGDRTIRFPAFTHAVCSGLYEIALNRPLFLLQLAAMMQLHGKGIFVFLCVFVVIVIAIKRRSKEFEVDERFHCIDQLTPLPLFIFFSYFWKDSEAVWNGWVFFHSIQCVTLHRMCFEMIERKNRVYMWKWFIWHVENGKRWVNRLRNSEERVANWVKR